MSNNNFNTIKKHVKTLQTVAVLLIMSITLPLFTTATALAEAVATDNQNNYERMIAHGGGTIAGFDTSSSMDAVNQAIDNGFKVIELDMEFSSDNQIIMLHDWDRTVETYLGRDFGIKLSESQFNGQLICGKFEPLTFKKLVKILEDNPEVRIITDTKGDNIKLLSTIAQKYPKVMNRIIPQIYQYDEYDTVEKLGYKDIILTLYAMNSVEERQLISFVKEKDLYAVTMPTIFAEKGLAHKLAKSGIIVYTHPVYTVEEAEQQFSKGVYGIYSSTLIPSEIEGLNLKYYLLQDEFGENVKLTDVTVEENAVRQIKIKGLDGTISLKYKLDGETLDTILPELEDSDSKAHLLTIELWDLTNASSQQPFYSMRYILTKDKGKVRVLDEKYEYRLEELKAIPSFREIITNSKAPWLDEDTKMLLKECFISKAGENYYYYNGNSGKYMVGDELISCQKDRNGKVLVPLADTLKLLGIQSVFMDSNKYVYISLDKGRVVSQVNSIYVSKGFYQKKVSTPIAIYRGKTMVGGEVLEIVTERSFLDNESYLIILPEATQETEVKKQKLLTAVALLYSEC